MDVAANPGERLPDRDAGRAYMGVVSGLARRLTPGQFPPKASSVDEPVRHALRVDRLQPGPRRGAGRTGAIPRPAIRRGRVDGLSVAGAPRVPRWRVEARYRSGLAAALRAPPGRRDRRRDVRLLL